MAEGELSGLERLPSRPSSRVLRPDEVQAWQDGQAFLAAARRETERMREAARRAYASEYARGYEEGKLEGRAEAARLMSEAAIKVDRYLAGLGGEVAGLAIEVVRRVLGEFEVRELVAWAARRAVAEVRRAKYVKLSVHPEAVGAVRAELDRLVAEAGLGFSLEVEADHKLSRDSCILATDAAVLDAGIETQLTAIAAAVGAGGTRR